MVGDVDVARAEPRQILGLRRTTLGYVSQFLRVVPRVPALDVVAEPLLAVGTPEDQARDRAQALLTRLRIPRTLWGLSPLTFRAFPFIHEAYPAALKKFQHSSGVKRSQISPMASMS